MKTIRVGTRGSKLALTQTEQTIEALRAAAPDLSFEVTVIKTKGDLIQTIALDKFGDKGIFVQEIEAQLLDGSIDIAVHSMKDMPSDITEGLAFSTPPKRQDTRDVLITKAPIASLDDLKIGAKIGTGSKRRLYQLGRLRRDLNFVPIRGNIDTRIKKIETENLDGVILAAAGIKRLSLDKELQNVYYFSPEELLPAPAQGTLAVQYRKDDAFIEALLARIADAETACCVEAERTFLSAIDGSCHVPIGAHATLKGDVLTLETVFGDALGENLYRASASSTAANAKELGETCAHKIREQMKVNGFVTLLGAGPGDLDLITVKGLKAIQNCDAIVYDRLASPKLLNYIRPEAEKYYVGKASGNHFYTQDETNALLVTLAKSGKKVVRLKGGDPYVFGRGGEEGAVLKEAGVAFEVVPGISSSIAGLNYAGIPITHRDHASSFHVFTAHFKDDDTTLDFKTIAALEGTLVFLMGIANMHKIATALLAHGKCPETPVAMISKATTYRQKTIVATLGTAVETLPNDMALSPALFVVGDVIKERDTLNWFEKKDLFGQKALVMRSVGQASKLSDALNARGCETVTLPMIEIVPEKVDATLSEALATPSINHLWFTSENAVTCFMAALDHMDKDVRALAPYKILAIGTSTAKCLKHHGLKADIVPKTFTQEGIIEAMTGQLSPSDHVLLPQGNLSRPLLLNWLEETCTVTPMTLYKTVPVAHDTTVIDTLKKQLATEGVVLPFTSSSTVDNFHDLCKVHGLTVATGARIIAIGPKTEETLVKHGYRVAKTAETHTIRGLIDAIAEEVINETL